MDNVIPMHRDVHRDAVTLLPWYVSGALDEDETCLVEAHLTDCADCRAELAIERRLADEIAALPADTEPAWAAMERRLAAPARRRPRATRKDPAIRAARAALPWIGWAIAAQILLVIGLQAVMAPRAPAPAGSTYHALSAAPTRPPADLAVIFRPRTTEADIRLILSASHARVTDGPTAADAWLLSVPLPERDTALRILRGRPEVLTAQPLDPVEP